MEKRFKEKIEIFREQGSVESLTEVLRTVADMAANGQQVVTPVDVDDVSSEEELTPDKVSLRHIQDGNGDNFLVAFTSIEEHKQGPDTNALFMPIDQLIETAEEEEYISGLVINPWTDSFILKPELINIVKEMNEKKKVTVSSLEDEFYLHVIEEKPVDFYAAASNVFMQFEAVNRVYITGLNNKGKECYLLIVDFEGEEVGNLFSSILETLPVPRDGKRIEMTPFTGSIPEGLTDLIYQK